MPKSRFLIPIALLVAVAITLPLASQDLPRSPRHHQYRLYDLGAFGGPNSFPSVNAITLSPAGATGAGDTPATDPFSPNCLADCFVKHAFQWREGVLTDLGALPGNGGGNSSYGFAINKRGLIAGISENGSIDPATGYPEVNAVVWRDGDIINLGTFGGAQSSAEMVNSRGQVVGVATNDVSDPFSFGGVFPATTQARAFLWERGVMQDLGTLGGPDAFAHYVNEGGQVAGWSYTNSTPNPTTGIPTVDPFLWRRGQMLDLGTLGGVFGQATWINNRGQVVGNSDLAGDVYFHAFLWDNGVLTDLGAATQFWSNALWISDAGDAVGWTNTGQGTSHGTLWSHGAAIDLGTLDGDLCSIATGINAARQVVGYSGPPCNASRGFLWENGGPMVDLNVLVEQPSNIVVTSPVQIDDRGRIAAQGVLANGDTHFVVLVPDGDCDSDCERRIADSQNRPASEVLANSPARLSAFGKPADYVRDPLSRALPALRSGGLPVR